MRASRKTNFAPCRFARKPATEQIQAMKKISIPEVAELVCDVTGKSAVASIKMEFWYGSTRYDGRRI